MKRTFLSLCLAAALATSLAAQAGDIKINEFSTGGTSWFELVNLGAAPVDISGWQLRGYWQNPVDNIPEWNYTFPGIPGTGTTTLNPEQCLVVSESATVPVAAGGSIRLTLPVVNSIPWFTGLAGSAAIYDDLGNGIDYVAWSNTQALECPLTLGGTSAVWASTFGLPVLGGIARGTTADISYRHTRTDTDAAEDWTNFGAAGSPGALNNFQFPIGVATGVPVATIQATTTCGPAPLDVGFQNVSTGQAELVFVQWDFDAVANPGISTANTHHASFTYNVSSQANLQILDTLGNLVTSTNTAITVSALAAVTPRTSCFVENFEFFPALVANTCGGTNVPDPASGFDFRGEPTARLRVVNGATLGGLGYNWPVAPGQGGTSCLLDVNPATPGTGKLVLHLDGTAINGGAGFRIGMWLQENNDETDPADYIGIQDGLTLGNGTTNTGAATAAAGLDGYREVRLLDWNAQAINRAWVFFDFVIDAAFLSANGLVLGPDMRIIISQRDNVQFEGNDGLAIDGISVRPITPTAGPGQPGILAEGLLDINSARNANCNLVNTTGDFNGPFFASASSTTGIAMTIAGEANQPIRLLSSSFLTPGAADYTGFGIGLVDIGVANPTPPFIPFNIQVLADGTIPDFLNSLFNTGPTGQVTFVFPTSFPPGLLGAFQCAVGNTTTIVKMTNAVELTIL